MRNKKSKTRSLVEAMNYDHEPQKIL